MKGHTPQEAIDRFRKRITKDFKTQPETWQELRWLMYEKNYRQKQGIKVKPTDKQVDLAMEFLKEKYPRQTVFNFRFEQYGKHGVHRATENILHRGKTYRKGQFLPRDIYAKYE